MAFFLFACNREEKIPKSSGSYQTAAVKETPRTYPPYPGRMQRIHGVVVQIGENVKSIWLELESRKDYMIISTALERRNRNDEEKRIRIYLDHISPLGSVIKGQKFRNRWKQHTTQVLERNLLNRSVFVDVNYQERAQKLHGVLYQVVNSKEGKRLRNVNLWMIYKGLSYYMLDRKSPYPEPNYRNAQNLAKERKSGLWKYQ